MAERRAALGVAMRDGYAAGRLADSPVLTGIEEKSSAKTGGAQSGE